VKPVQRGQLAGRSDCEDRAAAAGYISTPTRNSCPVEVPVSSLNQPGFRVLAVRTACLGAKLVQRSQCARWGDFEDRANVGPTGWVVPYKSPSGP
jgi:hypothetical protein